MATNWTQTPEGKAKLSRMMQARWKAGVFKNKAAAAAKKKAAKRTNTKGAAKRTNTNTQGASHAVEQRSTAEIAERHIAYAVGYITAWLEVFARSHDVPVASLTYRVGAVIRDSARR